MGEDAGEECADHSSVEDKDKGGHSMDQIKPPNEVQSMSSMTAMGEDGSGGSGDHSSDHMELTDHRQFMSAMGEHGHSLDHIKPPDEVQSMPPLGEDGVRGPHSSSVQKHTYPLLLFHTMGEDADLVDPYNKSSGHDDSMAAALGQVGDEIGP